MTETVMGLIVGVGLSAACGFRVFVPLLAVSVAASGGYLSLTHEFAWMGSYPALVAFAVATALEVSGYYFPVVDNFLDTVASPAAVVAGTMITASFIADMSPFLKWTLALVAGGGVAGLVQGTTVVARSASTAGTGGLANPVLATAELGGAVATSLLSLFLPLLVLPVIFLLLGVLAFWLLRRRRRRGVASAPISPA